MTAAGARAVATAVVAVGAGVLPMFLTAALAPRIGAEFSFGALSLGVAVAGFHAVSALASPRFGRWVGRVGAVRCLDACAAIAVASSVAIAVGARSAAGMIVLLSVAGLANAASGPAASALLSRTVQERRRGAAFGALQAGAPAAALLAGLALSLVAGPAGWRSAFVVAALLGLLLTVLVPRRPGDAAASPVPRRAGTAGAGPLRGLVLAAALASATTTGMMAFLVEFAVDSGITEQDAGLLLGLVSGVAIVSRIGLGLAVDRLGSDPLSVAMVLLAAGAVGCLLLGAAAPGLIVAGALMVGGLGWAWTGLLTLVVVRLRPDAPGRAVGDLMVGLFAGAVAGPALFGVMVRDGDYRAAWLGCAALAGLAGVCVIAARSLAAGADVRPWPGAGAPAILRACAWRRRSAS